MVRDDQRQLATLEDVAARVLADARRSFTGIDTAVLERNVDEIVSQLWHESTKVTTFIPVLAIRDLGKRLHQDHELPRD